jgi:hypothetical protein
MHEANDKQYALNTAESLVVQSKMKLAVGSSGDQSRIDNRWNFIIKWYGLGKVNKERIGNGMTTDRQCNLNVAVLLVKREKRRKTGSKGKETEQ